MGVYLRGKVWWMNYKLKGQEPIRMSTEILDGPGAKKAAEDIYRNARNEAKEGKTFKKPSSIKTSDALAKYWKDFVINGSVSERRNKSIAIRHWNRFHGNRPWASIAVADVLKYFNGRLEEGYVHKEGGKVYSVSPITVAKELSCIQTAYGVMADDPEINVTINPVAEAKRKHLGEKIKKAKVRRDRTASTEELRALWKALPRLVREVVLFAVVSGMRKGDIRFLRWDQINLRTRIAKLDAKSTKEAKDRNVPIHRDAMKVLLGRPRLGEFVFCTDDGAQLKEFGVMHTQFKAAKAKLGIKNLRFHDLRHTFGTFFTDDVKDLGAASRIMGHSDPKITADIYVNTANQTLVNRIDEMRSVLSDVSRESNGFVTPIAQMFIDGGGYSPN